MDKEFKGVYPALITPMDSDGKLNESALRKVIEFNINAGVHGFWVAGGTGESVLLDDAEDQGQGTTAGWFETFSTLYWSYSSVL